VCPDVKITINGLIRHDTGCFIAVHIMATVSGRQTVNIIIVVCFTEDDDEDGSTPVTDQSSIDIYDDVHPVHQRATAAVTKATKTSETKSRGAAEKDDKSRTSNCKKRTSLPGDINHRQVIF